MPPFTSFQQGFKKAWKRLSDRDIGYINYLTNVNPWLCNCGSQELHTYHLRSPRIVPPVNAAIGIACLSFLYM